MGNEINIGDIADLLALHIMNHSHDSLTIKEVAGVDCCAISEYCSENNIPNDVFANQEY